MLRRSHRIRTAGFCICREHICGSDSPLESKRFADAEIDKGFVVRAVDNSNIVPVKYVDRVLALAKENGIRGAIRRDRRGKRRLGVLAVWFGGCGAGVATALLAFTGRGD